MDNQQNQPKPVDTTPLEVSATSGMYNPPNPVDQEFAAQESNAEIAELSAKLGIDPNAFSPEETNGLETPNEVPQQADQGASDDFIQKFNSAEGLRLRNEFKRIAGVDVVEAYGVVQNTAKLLKNLETWRQQVVNQQQQDNLKQEWGESYQELMPQVVQRFGELKTKNPKLAQALDNIDGARLLAAQIRQESGQPQPHTPAVLTGKTQSITHRGNQSPTIRMSDFMNWSDAEVQSRMGEVLRAKQAGTFIHDL